VDEVQRTVADAESAVLDTAVAADNSVEVEDTVAPAAERTAETAAGAVAHIAVVVDSWAAAKTAAAPESTIAAAVLRTVARHTRCLTERLVCVSCFLSTR